MTPASTGIDVGRKYQDIRRIVLKYFSVAGVHPDDLVQDVCMRLLEQNKLPCVYDPARGAFSTYVYRVASNRAARFARHESKQARVRAALREELRPRAGWRPRLNPPWQLPVDATDLWTGPGRAFCGDRIGCAKRQ